MMACRNWGVSRLEELSEEFSKSSAYSRQLQESRLLFDIPSEHPLKLGEDILVELDRNRAVPLYEVSEIANTLPIAFQSTAIRLRVFYHPSLSADVVDNLGQEVREFIEGKVGTP